MNRIATSATTGARHGDQEHVTGRLAEGRLEDRRTGAGSVDMSGIGAAAARRRRSTPSAASPLVTLVGDLVAQRRAEGRDADRATHRAEERDHGARGTHVALGGVVLHREHEVLHRRAEAEAEHRHERADPRPGWWSSSIVLSSESPTTTNTMPPTR